MKILSPMGAKYEPVGFGPMSVLGSALAAFLLFAASGCHSAGSAGTVTAHSDTTYTLTGKIEGLDSDWVYLVHQQSDAHLVDSVQANHGNFIFTGRMPYPEYCQLIIQNEVGNPYRSDLFLENGELTFTGKKDSLYNAILVGGPQQEEFKRFLKSEEPFSLSYSGAIRSYQDAKTQNDRQQMDSLEKILLDMNEQLKRSIKNYAIAHPSSYAAVFELSLNFAYNPDPHELDSAYTGLDSSVRVSYFGKKVKEILDNAMRTAIGGPAPDFMLPDGLGKPVALSSFRGKITLVDFWASWCGPCRGENPAVVKAYRKYHPKGLAILGVSLDDQKDNWEKAIKKDRLPWTQVSDLKGWQNSAAVLYGVQGIPMNFLLDKKGKIIAKGLRGKDLEKKLAEVMN